jgi:4-hydroxy-tetrahydrodipicolinate synthase
MEGKIAEARFYNELLIDIHPWLYKDGSPSGIKAAMHILGFSENELRLPLVPCSESTYLGLAAEIEKLKKKLA